MTPRQYFSTICGQTAPCGGGCGRTINRFASCFRLSDPKRNDPCICQRCVKADDNCDVYRRGKLIAQRRPEAAVAS